MLPFSSESIFSFKYLSFDIAMDCILRQSAELFLSVQCSGTGIQIYGFLHGDFNHDTNSFWWISLSNRSCFCSPPCNGSILEPDFWMTDWIFHGPHFCQIHIHSNGNLHGCYRLFNKWSCGVWWREFTTCLSYIFVQLWKKVLNDSWFWNSA